jgi:two-component system cell cycle response regulator DivK
MKPRVLVIEDNEQNRYLAGFLLERAGAELTFARNGAEGVRAAKESRPDIIVMDMQMPEMDGYTAARMLVAEPETAGIPMIAVTSYAMAGDRGRAIDCGFSDYLEKPFDPESFAQRVLALAGRGIPKQGPDA